MASRLKQGDTSLLAEMHATTSGLKVYVSACGVQDLETARRSMGGHGYSAFAGVGRLYADYLPSVTYVLNFIFPPPDFYSATLDMREITLFWTSK